ncbi:MAG: UMP kinase [Candidatus Paceibacterota bacterium]
MKNNEPIVISLGGSLIVPDEINVDFLNSFVLTIKDYVLKGFNFLIITGGGKVCRRYNNSLKQIINPSDEDLDWLGIASTRLNAELVRICFGDYAYEKVILDPEFIPKTDKPIMVGGGWKPGNSSDLAAVYGAKSVGAQKIINLSNIDFVYDKDPKINSDAKPIYKMTWDEFRFLFPKNWNPGSNTPFDTIAAYEAEKLGYEVVILNGNNIDNLKNYLDEKEFVGTVIE